MNIEIKYQACNLCTALLRNINDNFISVSFSLNDSGDIQTKFILAKLTEYELELIDDIILEFSSLQERNCVLEPIIEIGKSLPLQNIIYMITAEEVF